MSDLLNGPSLNRSTISQDADQALLLVCDRRFWISHPLLISLSKISMRISVANSQIQTIPSTPHAQTSELLGTFDAFKVWILKFEFQNKNLRSPCRLDRTKLSWPPCCSSPNVNKPQESGFLAFYLPFAYLLLTFCLPFAYESPFKRGSRVHSNCAIEFGNQIW